MAEAVRRSSRAASNEAAFVFVPRNHQSPCAVALDQIWRSMNKKTLSPTPPLDEGTQTYALYLAMVVRNAMENFHVQHLSDAQMRELNPIIRNALATALYAMQERHQNPVAAQYVDFHLRMIPPYWEPPVLLTTFQQRSPPES